MSNQTQLVTFLYHVSIVGRNAVPSTVNSSGVPPIWVRTSRPKFTLLAALTGFGKR